MTVKAAKIAQPTRLPSTMTAIVSQSPSLRTMPSAPRAQLIGAMLAPAQIHICCGPVESLSASGMGSMLWTSALSSAPAAVAMRASRSSGVVRSHRLVRNEAETPARYCAADGDAVKIHGEPERGRSGAGGRPAQRVPALFRPHLVDRGAVGSQHDAVFCGRARGGDLAVEHVGENRRGVALQRIAVARAARDVLPELVAGVQHDHLLRRQLLAGPVLAHDERTGARAGGAALETPRRRSKALAAVRDHHVRRRGLEDLFEPEATAEASRAARIDPQPSPRDAQRKIHLHRL